MSRDKFISDGDTFVHVDNRERFKSIGNTFDIYNTYETVPRVKKGDPEGGQWTSEWATSGAEFDSRKKDLRIPPAWTEVRINKDNNADLLATGHDAKGRKQYIYSQNATMRTAALKFEKNKELLGKFAGIEVENSRNMKSKDPNVSEAADVMALIISTGIRPGSDAERGGDKTAYGATTLQGRHVVITANGGVRLQFIGKKGVAISIPVRDEQIASMLKEKKDSAGSKGRLFNVSDSQLRDYAKTLNGGKFNPKDFRTLKGTATAMAEVTKYKRASGQKQYKKYVNEIGDRVSKVLGNTRAIALKSYINPFVFLDLQPK